MQGRKPLPTNVKMLKGTAQKSRLNDAEPIPNDDKLDMPKGLSDDAQKCWQQVVNELKDAGIMTNIDTHALMLYCEAYARYMDANRNIRRFGTVIKAPSGFPVQSPYLAIANKAFDQMKSILVEFGMTPSSRTKVKSTKAKKQDDPWADI